MGKKTPPRIGPDWDLRTVANAMPAEDIHEMYITLLGDMVTDLQEEITRARTAGVAEPYLIEEFFNLRMAGILFQAERLQIVLREKEGRCLECGGKLRKGKRDFCSLEHGNNFRTRDLRFHLQTQKSFEDEAKRQGMTLDEYLDEHRKSQSEPAEDLPVRSSPKRSRGGG